MKSQVSIEFMILVSILLLIFVFLLGGGSYLRNDMMSVKIKNEAKKLSNDIAFEINTAVKTGNGYSRRFYVSDSFAGIYNYSIEIENYLVTISWIGGSVYSQIVTKNITGDVKKGWNLIENKNGVIYVS
ncbi:MAG: hypothetical protein QXO27_03925 [Candidatus Aenigmatarchaeota archaeon]